MEKTVNAKELRRTLPDVVRRVRQGERYLVIYRSRPAFRIVPLGDVREATPLDEDPLFQVGALGRSRDGFTARDVDQVLYGSPPR